MSLRTCSLRARGRSRRSGRARRRASPRCRRCAPRCPARSSRAAATAALHSSSLSSPSSSPRLAHTSPSAATVRSFGMFDAMPASWQPSGTMQRDQMTSSRPACGPTAPIASKYCRCASTTLTASTSSSSSTPFSSASPISYAVSASSVMTTGSVIDCGVVDDAVGLQPLLVQPAHVEHEQLLDLLGREPGLALLGEAVAHEVDRLVELVHDPRRHGVEAMGLTPDGDRRDHEHAERRDHCEHDRDAVHQRPAYERRHGAGSHVTPVDATSDGSRTTCARNSSLGGQPDLIRRRVRERHGSVLRCRCAGRAARGGTWDHRRGARSSWPA